MRQIDNAALSVSFWSVSPTILRIVVRAIMRLCASLKKRLPLRLTRTGSTATL